EIERPLAPRSRRDLAHRKTSVTEVRGQASELLRAAIDLFEIINREIDVVPVRTGLAPIAIAFRAVDSQHHIATPEVMASARYTHAGLSQQLGIKRRRGFDVVNGQNHAKHTRGRHSGHSLTRRKPGTRSQG